MTQGNDQLPVGEPPSTEGPLGKTDKEQSHLEPVGVGAKALRGSRRTARRFPRAWRGLARQPGAAAGPHSPPLSRNSAAPPANTSADAGNCAKHPCWTGID